MGTIRAALFIVGTTVGAGFLTGAELMRFFGSGGYLFALLLSCTLYFVNGVLFITLGRRYGGCQGAMCALFGRAGKAIYYLLLAVSFFPCAGMIAGLDALLPTYAPLPSVLGLALVVFFLCHGLKGVGVLNTALVPFLLALVVLTGSGGISLCYFSFSDGVNAMLYAGMNTAFAAPALMDAGCEIRKPPHACALAAGCIFVCGVCILGGIARLGESALTSPMPYLTVIEGRRVFTVAVACSVLTSLSSALYPLFMACDRLGKQKNAAKCIVLLAAFVLSRIGLERVIDIFYPVAGMIGVAFSAVCIFDEYLFQQYHKRIHSCRQKAQNKGCAHHEIQLEYLTAIDYEISESCPRDNVFSHDGADPCHTHINFQHGDNGRIGGRDNQFP